ncbi:helix-turn-helix domain-containing protein [Belliella pelovolcani]|uniref:Helix-turn-helix domain-containing protein n=1 Tax=Belliella pelovolcani TaxID=529505 RepID=A0A1N7PVP9_9BACT|nr:helix-turn-helix domain-containing protein [Belliella pelovolcani]SIT14694.1 Helix-turn-helix domain-containing protein [Belliella pelovolcani]
MESTDRLELAAHFVNTTSSPIFLTGKAGTGKTTFLRNLTELTHKSHIIIAPTGIAALHAKGVTVHSQFLFPFGSFLPTKEPEGNFSNSGNFYTQYTLNRKHPLNAARKKVLNSIELIIIDEVSMLRADLLDAIDYRMKKAKQNFEEPFGGVQVLMIGDLFQLPPIVKDQEWQVLAKFYKSMHFFEAKALQSSGLVYIELNKIFRQRDEQFISILNHLRDNQVSAEDIQFLNRFYKTPDEIKALKDYIIITTHNYKAEEHNSNELRALKSKSHFFEAIVSKDFPESLYPIPKKLELKEGAQVMFIKNDSSGLSDYFNGKMAMVKDIFNDEIKVIMNDSKMEYVLHREVWENKRYVVKEETKELEEEIIGTFEHFPIKLAWAVTVHKSQGLTFDKAIIDVGQAFAPGQVYVALSRLRSLDGLVLRTRIQSHIISSDPTALHFTNQTNTQQAPLDKLLENHQTIYIQKLLSRTFDFSPLITAIGVFQKEFTSTMVFEDKEMREAMGLILEKISQEEGNTYKFTRQLNYLVHTNDQLQLMDRLEKGSTYYSKLFKSILKDIITHQAEVEQFTKTKGYLDSISEIETMLLRKLNEIMKVGILVPAILNGEEIGRLSQITDSLTQLRISLAQEAKEATRDNPKFASTKTGRKKKKEGTPKIKLEKGETFEITYTLSREGHSVEEIAKERGLAKSTIESHLAKGILKGQVDIHQHLSKEIVQEAAIFIEIANGEISKVVEKYPEKFDYATLRMVAAHMARD